MLCKIFPVIFYVGICAFSLAEQRGENNLERKYAGFLFTMPQTLVSGRNETVCMSLHEARVPAKVIVDLKWKEKHFFTTRHLDAEQSCFQIHVPNKKLQDPQYVGIRVQVQINGTVYSSHNQDPVLVYPEQLDRIFIETDRGKYKPGDKVLFRVLVVDYRGIPSSSKIREIRIRNPLDVTTSVWENLVPNNGLLHVEYELVNEALEGKWKIECGDETTSFQVSKYVLPRFKVDLRYPKTFYYANSTFNVDICAYYSYNQVVKGLASLKLSDSHNIMIPVDKLLELRDGCASFEIGEAELNLKYVKDKFLFSEPKITIQLTSSVTEQGTNRVETATGRTSVLLRPFVMKFQSETTFQPGLPYKGKIKLTNVNVDIDNVSFEICYNVAVKKSWNYLDIEQCSNFTANSHDYTIEFTVPPLKNNIIHVTLNARSTVYNNVGDSFLVVRQFSPTSSYLHLQHHVQDKNERCGHQQFTVFFTTDKLKDNQHVTFFYMIKTRMEILKLRKIVHPVRKTTQDMSKNLTNIIGDKHRFVKTGTGVDKFVLRFKFDKMNMAKYQILVYYVTRHGETVAFTKNIEIPPCLLKVEVGWLQNRTVPGDTATLRVKTETKSLCSVTAVDKATKFVLTSHQSLDFERIWKKLSKEREPAPSGRKTCVTPTRKNKVSELSYKPIEESNSIWDLRRKKRHVYSFSEDFDTYDVFNKYGTITITNLKLISKLCYTGPLLKDPNQVQFLTNQYEDNVDETQVTIRSYFPEAWLWELVPVGEEVQLKRHLPHTVTSWLTNVLCISKNGAIGFGTPTEIIAFQPFFIDVITPYSIKKGENFYLSIHISNYLKTGFPARISLRLSSELQLVSPLAKLTTSFCIPENNTITYSYHVKSTSAGLANLTVMAETDKQFPTHCSTENVVSRRDIVLKTIHVEPEGFLVTNTKSAMLCPSFNTTSNVSWSLNVPPDVVIGTDNAYVTLNGDLLGKTIENLEELLTIPTGCGEQIMASIAPNLYVLRYLNATKSLTNSLRQKIIRNLKIGYQRILNYVHEDGSFSAFGYYDPSGSMFLTAFVVRTLQEAKQYIYVDQRVIDKAVAWIFDYQLENGCFSTMLHVFQDMGGTSTENSTAGLTAYVILSLMEVNVEVPDFIQLHAKYCIRGQHDPDKYALAISCYALFKLNWISEATRLLNRLVAISNREQDMIWWSNKYSNETTASDIEITSYVLLSLLHQNTTENLAKAHSVARWLTSKLGPTGAFSSTQDTVVALDAMSKYATFIRSRKLNVTVSVRADDKFHQVALDHKNIFLSKRIVLDHDDRDIKIGVDGEGCVLAQLVHTFYQKNIPISEAFNLALDVSSVSNIDQCSINTVTPCISYKGPDDVSNMAVMEVALPSGYQADRASLYKLVETGLESKVKKFEEAENKVNLYFTKLGKQQLCFSFNINENSLIEERKENLVKLYDYYRPEYNVLQFYATNINCTAKNISEIPQLVAYHTHVNTKDGMDFPKTANETHKNLLKRDLRSLGTYFNRKKLRNKRQSSRKGLNPDFVDLNVKLDTPDCMPVPDYKKSPSKRLKKRAKDNSTLIAIQSSIDFIKHEKCGSQTANHSSVSLNVKTDTFNERDDVEYITDTPSKDPNRRFRFKRNTKKVLNNSQFVDKNVALQTSNCLNVPFYTQPYNIKRSKRDISTNIKSKLIFHKKQPKKDKLNPKFVDKDVKMATPNTMEANNDPIIFINPFQFFATGKHKTFNFTTKLNNKFISN